MILIWNTEYLREELDGSVLVGTGHSFVLHLSSPVCLVEDELFMVQCLYLQD
jgi:hypothetical protein